MILVVTIVSAMVHVYSIGYMAHDPGIPRFMSYLSLFTFFMLMLVTADNFVQLFFGWEGVGLSSYLLIGFWYDRATANDASIKAFIVNRVGDFGFALGIFAVFVIFGSLDFDVVFGESAGGGRHDDKFPRLAGIVARTRLHPAVRRRDGEIGADRAAHLAARRDGGSRPRSRR